MIGCDCPSSRGSSSSPPPFLTKTYEMVDDPSTDSAVSWSSTNASFVVRNPLEFARDLLPKYFKHNNYSSFVRQLNTYGFRKIDPAQWEFANDDFIRGQRHRLKNIHRRKPVHSHSLHNQGNSLGSLSEAEKQELEEEIERLNQEKDMLMIEFQQHTQQQDGMEHQMQSLEEKLQDLENRQRSLVAFLTRITQKPGFLSNCVHQSDAHSKKRRLLKIDYFNESGSNVDDLIVSFQPIAGEKSDVLSVHTLDIEPFEKMESSLNSLENIFRGVSQVPGDDISYDNFVPCLPSAILTEMTASSGEIDVNLQSLFSKLHPASPCIGDIHSSMEIVESTSYAETPAIPATEVQIDSRSKVSEIDVNTEPAATEDDLSRYQTTGAPVSTVPTGVNDEFWGQFLTEVPSSSDTQEVQSKRRDSDDKQSEGKMDEQESGWWNRKNVDHLAEKMGNLTSTEKT